MRTALVFFLALIIAPSAGAALLAPSSEIVGLHLSPANPSPGELVTATVRSTGNSGAFSYEWSVDGRVVAEGPNEKTISVNAGEPGSQTIISVRLVGASGDTRGSAARAIRPAEVDIVWEGRTYVPPFYEGRPLVSASNPLVILAIPRVIENGRGVPSGELIYEWRINDLPLSDQSGIGRSFIEVVPPFFDSSFTVSVTAVTLSGAVAAEGRAVLTPALPVMVVYQDFPLSGVGFDRAKTGPVAFSENELSFKAYPFFVGDPEELSYAWELNGVTVTNPVSPRSLTVRKESDERGEFVVKVSFKSAFKLFEKGLVSFKLSI